MCFQFIEPFKEKTKVNYELLILSTQGTKPYQKIPKLHYKNKTKRKKFITIFSYRNETAIYCKE